MILTPLIKRGHSYTHTSAEIVSLIQCYNCINENSEGSSTHTRTTDFYNVTVSFMSSDEEHTIQVLLKVYILFYSTLNICREPQLSYMQNLSKTHHHNARV